MTKATGKRNRTYKLTPEERKRIALLVACKRWPKKQIADLYGVHPRTVTDCADRYPFDGPYVLVWPKT